MRITNATLRCCDDVTRENSFLSITQPALTESTSRQVVQASQRRSEYASLLNWTQIQPDVIAYRHAPCLLCSPRPLVELRRHRQTRGLVYFRAHFTEFFGRVSFGLSQAYMVTRER